MLIAQISDGHVTEPGRLLQGRYDALTRFKQALTQLTQESPRPDFLIHTGDLVHERGSELTYRTVYELLEASGIPYAVIPGDHDQIELMRATFATKPWMPKAGPLHFTIDHLPVRLLCLHTMIPGRVEGTLDDQGLAWLSDRLAEYVGIATSSAGATSAAHRGRVCCHDRPHRSCTGFSSSFSKS